MSFSCVRSPEEDDIRLLDFAVGACSTPRTKHRRQTDDARSVSGSVAAIDVVGAEGDPGEFLRHEVHFVRGLRARENAEGIRTASVDVATETIGRSVECLIPADWSEDTVLADERFGEAGIASNPAG
jgi:hypothetical protein